MNKLIKLVFIFSMSIQCGIVSAEMQTIDRVVALVDSDVVLASELVRRTKSVMEQLKNRDQKMPEVAQLTQQVLDRLILESLQLQMAKRVGVRVNDAELDATIGRVAEESKMNVDQFRKKVVNDGTPWAIFREDIRNEIMISRVRGGHVSRRVKISDKEIDNLMIQINQEGLNRTQYLLGHILLALPESASPEHIARVREEASKMIAELRNGANFEQYAVAYSAGQNALNGGELGWRSLTQLPSLFAGNVKNMKVGDISDPLRSGSGLHILYLKDSKGGFETHRVMQTHARHILISPNAITDEQAALEKLQLVRQRIIDGEKFEDLAIEFSDDKGSGAIGGDLKWSDPGTFVPEFNKVMNELAINELSEAVKTEFGWHLIEVLGRRDQDQTEDKKRERAYRIIHNRKFEEEAQIWLGELKEQAYIKIIDEK